MGDFGSIIDSIKEQLNITNSQSRDTAISDLLKVLRENKEEQFVMHLIYNGIISDLLLNVDRTNRRELLECIEIVVNTNAFYTNGLVDATLEGITMHRLIDSFEEAAKAVRIVLTIVTKVFVEFSEMQGTLLINKHEEGLLDLIERAIFDSFSMRSAASLFNFLVKYSTKDFKRARIPNIKSIYTTTMNFLMSADEISDSEKLQIVCHTSNSVANFCNEIDENDFDIIILSGSSVASSVNAVPEIKKDIIESIRTISIEHLIPLAKRSEVDIETANILIEFLETAIKLREIKDSVLCTELLSQGYLRYLLELSLFQPERLCFRSKVCSLIAEIIVTLEEYLELPIDHWRGGSVAFQIFLRSGLESLPIDIEKWEDLLKSYTHESNSLMVLLFCHFIGTEEKYIFTQESLAVKLTSDIEECTEPIFLRALWLLYSVAALASKTLNSDRRLYKKAAKCLATSLGKQKNFELAYTHNVDLLFHSIKETDFPEKLRYKVISLWLENSSRNEEFDTFIQECLVQCYDELKIVKLLMTISHKSNIKNLGNALNAYVSLLRFIQKIPEDVVEFVWKTLGEDLACYTPNNSNILKTVLRITGTLPISKYVPARIMGRCARGICKVLVRDDTDMILKVLLITAAAFAIRQSVEQNESEVAKIFLKDDRFLKEVHDDVFSMENISLTEMSLRTLSCLTACQILYNIQSNTVSEMSFKDLQTLLMNLIEQVSPTMFGIEFLKFLLGNELSNPVIKLRKFEDNSDSSHMYYVYFLVHAIHAEIFPGEENQIYQCLSTFLNYCSDHKLNMISFLTCSSTPLLVELAIKGFPFANQISYDFLEFTTIWLGYVKTARSRNQIPINGITQSSVELLIKFTPFVLDLNDSDNDVVHNFLKAISDFMKKPKK